MPDALFINSVPELVFREILDAQNSPTGRDCFLQPSMARRILLLAKARPSPDSPVRLYASTKQNKTNVCYTAEIIGWENKQEMSAARRLEVLTHLETFQKNQVLLFTGLGKRGKDAVNLTKIRHLRRVEPPFPIGKLINVRSGLPRKEFGMANYSIVHDLGDFVECQIETRESLDLELAREIEAAKARTDAELVARLVGTDGVPLRVQIVSTGFRRNADVIEVVLRRADGRCEECLAAAPFTRRSDGSPYLEVHHVQPLAQGGLDTVENAKALCPNCHRYAHHG